LAAIEQLAVFISGDIIFVIAVLLVAWYASFFVSFRYSTNGRPDDPAIVSETKYARSILMVIAGVGSGLVAGWPAVAALGAGLLGYDYLASRHWKSGPKLSVLMALSLAGLVIGQLMRVAQLQAG